MEKISIIRKIRLLLIVSCLVVALPIEANDQPIYQIINVESWDTLNLRSAPGVKSEVVAKIPANAESILLLGIEVSVGKTVWVKINWQGKKGWVSQYYLKPKEVKSPPKTEVKKAPKQALEAPATMQRKVVVTTVEKGVGVNQWILRCSNTKPFWRVDVYPKALKIFTGKYDSLLPITYKKQVKNKWNTAKKTHLKGANSKDKIDLQIHYSYQKCDDALSKLKVPYKAIVQHNGKEMKGCCRALKIN